MEQAAQPLRGKKPEGSGTSTVEATGTGIPSQAGWYVLGARSFQGQPPPREVISFGGQSFPEWCYDENPTIKNDSIEYNQRRRGQRVFLDEDDLKRLRASLGKKLVRTRSEAMGRFVIIPADGKAAQRRLNGDKPLESFIYISPCDAPDEAPGLDEDAPPPIG